MSSLIVFANRKYTFRIANRFFRFFSIRVYQYFFVLLLTGTLAACGGGGGSSSSSSNPNAPAPSPSGGMSQAATIGQKIFLDASLSASGLMSCATCHNPSNAHAQTNSFAVQLGGTTGTEPGFRAVPSLRYLAKNPAFFFDSEGTPTGGFDRDGRAQTLAEQGVRPFLSVHEMANATTTDVVNKLKLASYAQEFRQVFGEGIFSDSDVAFNRIVFALQQYQREDPDFNPFNSKYDQFLAGRVALTNAELRGLALFNSPSKGNCAACHPSAKGADGALPLFTDFTFDNLGVPRNSLIPATADPAYFDLGLCGPDRTDLTTRADLCGAFKVPTLRNVATRKVFFHNGKFTNLRDVIRFYVRRDTNPEEWYPLDGNGIPQKFNDLPPEYHAYVNTTEVPYNRVPGMLPALTEQEIDDVLTFLNTLNDGYVTP